MNKPKANPSYNDFNRDLCEAEDSALRLVDLAEKTCQLLEESPFTDSSQLSALAREFGTITANLHEKLTVSSQILLLEPTKSDDGARNEIIKASEAKSK